MEANRPAFVRLSSTCLTSLQSQSVNVSSNTRCSCGDQLELISIRFCRAPREDPKAMAEHSCPFFLPQMSSKLSTSTTTIQNECELKSAPMCSPRKQFGAKLCECVPLSLFLTCTDLQMTCVLLAVTCVCVPEYYRINQTFRHYTRPGSLEIFLKLAFVYLPIQSANLWS